MSEEITARALLVLMQSLFQRCVSCSHLCLGDCLVVVGFFVFWVGFFKEKGCKGYLFMLQNENSFISTPP